MQEPRRRRWLQLHVLSLAFGCAAAPPPSSPNVAVEPVERTPPSELASQPEPSESDAPASADATPASADASPLPTGTKILQVGDSFADALGMELGKLLKEAGLRTSLETKTPSYIGEWAHSPVLWKALANYNPDLVLITLGANEVEVPAPAERVGPVQRLVRAIGDRPCVWILPPLWKPDTGVMQVIKDNAKPCQVLDSSALVPSLPRGPDHIHPSREGRGVWAKAVFEWLRQARDPNGPRPWSLRGGPS